MAPVFLTFDEILEIHRDQIARYGGEQGIRDLGLLQSALAQPTAMFAGQFLHADLFEMAAAYPLVDQVTIVGARKEVKGYRFNVVTFPILYDVSLEK